MRKIIEALTFILPFSKDPDDEFSLSGKHDTIYVLGIDWDRVSYEAMRKLVDEYDFIPGDPDGELYDFEDEDGCVDWDNITEEQWNNTPKDCLDSMAFKYC